MKISAKRIVAVVVVTFIPYLAYAAGLVSCGPEKDPTDPSRKMCELKDLFGLLVTIYNFLLGMAGLVAFGFLVYGGVKMLLYSVNEENLAEGKKTVTEAIIGLAIVATAYLLVNTLLTALGVRDPGSYFSNTKFLGG